jgi:hypothetical protein
MTMKKVIPYIVLVSIILYFLFTHYRTFETFTSSEKQKTKDDKAKELLAFTQMVNRVGDNISSVKETFMSVPRYVSSFIPRPRLTIW